MPRNTTRCDYVKENGKACAKLVRSGEHLCVAHGGGEPVAESNPTPVPGNTLSPGQQAQEMAMAAAGVPVPSREAREPKKKQYAPLLPGQQAGDIASQLYARDKASTIARQKDRAAKRKKDGKRPLTPMSAIPDLPDLPDPLAMTTNGKPWFKEGEYARWVATRDVDKRPSDLPQTRFKSLGGRHITNAEAGTEGPPNQPVKRYGMVAMACPLLNWGAHQYRSSPRELYARDWDINDLEEFADRENTRAGRTTGQLIVQEGHGEYEKSDRL